MQKCELTGLLAVDLPSRCKGTHIYTVKMADEENATLHNSQLVRYLLTLRQLHNAEYGPEDAFSLYHMLQEESGKYVSQTGIGPALPALGHALAGGLASASAKAIIYPIELVVTRLQVQRQLRRKGEAESAARDADQEYTSLIDAAKKIYKTEGGVKAFYQGCAPDIGKGLADSFLFFLAYTFVRQYEIKRAGSKQLPIHKELGVGVAAGSFAKLITTPIQNIVTRQQTAALVAARNPESTTTPEESQGLSIKDVFLQIRSERGLAGFWAGYSESVILTLNPAMTFAIDNLLTRLVAKSRTEKSSPQITFLIAAVSKAIATTITYPATLAKTRKQVSSSGSGDVDIDEKLGLNGEPEYLEKPNMSSTPNRLRVKRTARKALAALASLFKAQHALLLTLRKIYNQEGVSGLYSGLEGEVIKGFVQHGLTMMAKERVHVGVIQMYYLLLRSTKRWPADLQKVQDGAKDAAADAQERVANVGETVSEGAKRMAEKAKNL